MYTCEDEVAYKQLHLLKLTVNNGVVFEELNDTPYRHSEIVNAY